MMLDYVFDYLESKMIFVCSQEEQVQMANGIILYLKENGIEISDRGEYFKKYILDHTSQIDNEDLKSYFICYPLISRINQIVFEWMNDGKVSDTRKTELYCLLMRLYSAGLGDKYLPSIEIKRILGNES